ncbi:MAG: hypothetical protein R3D58_21710 [Saprospiraceae bacterium]|nr:hypothetical protein [Lewinellaceae bacterium]
MKSDVKHKKGHFISLGIAMGIPLGIPLGLALGNIAYGPLIGICAGLTVGYILEKKFNAGAEEIFEAEYAKQKRIALILLGIGLFVLATVAAVCFS